MKKKALQLLCDNIATDYIVIDNYICRAEDESRMVNIDDIRVVLLGEDEIILHMKDRNTIVLDSEVMENAV